MIRQMMTFLRSRSGNVVMVGRPQLCCCRLKNEHCADRKWQRHPSLFHLVTQFVLTQHRNIPLHFRFRCLNVLILKSNNKAASFFILYTWLQCMIYWHWRNNVTALR